MAEEMDLLDKKKAERKARKAARAAAGQAILDGWQPLVEAHFDYLQKKYHFRLTYFDTSNWWYMRVVYQTDTTAVYIDRNLEFQAAEISLVHLTNGIIPSWEEEQGNGFLFNNLLEVRAPQLLPVLAAIRGLKDKQIEATLAFLAHTLEIFAADVLQGDFSILPILEELYQQRRNKRGQVNVEGHDPSHTP